MRTRILGAVFLSIAFATGCRSFSSRKKPTLAPGPDKTGGASGVAVDIQERVDEDPSSAAIVETQVIKGLRDAGIQVRAYGKPLHVVMGEAKASFAGKSELYGMATSVYSATVSLRVIDKHTGKILKAASADVRKMATEKKAAAHGALRDAADRAMKKIIDAIPKPAPETKAKPEAKPASKPEPKKGAGKKVVDVPKTKAKSVE